MAMPFGDPYTTLGVPHDASADQIRHAYRKLVQKYHPDKGGDSGRALQRVVVAYRQLRDSAGREGERDERKPSAAARPVDRPTPSGPPITFGPVHWQPSRPTP